MRLEDNCHCKGLVSCFEEKKSQCDYLASEATFNSEEEKDRKGNHNENQNGVILLRLDLKQSRRSKDRCGWRIIAKKRKSQ